MLRPPHPHEVVLVLASEEDLYEVLAIGGEVVADGSAPPGSEGEILALPLILDDVERDLECLDAGGARRESDGQSGQLARHGHVALHVCGRDGEGVGVVVEAPVRRLVSGEEGPDIHVEGEELVYGVVVFEAV